MTGIAKLLAVLYMSGYSDGLLGSEHILDGGIAFIEKPFTATRLLTEISDLAGTVSSTTPAPGRGRWTARDGRA